MDYIEWIEEYQCSGCMLGGDTQCGYFEQKDDMGIGCKEHVVGTFRVPFGWVYLGMPKGFNRLGEAQTKIFLFESREQQEQQWGYNKLNIPVWKYQNEQGHVFVRGLMPRINTPFLHVILEDCLDKIDCLEITEEDRQEWD